MVSITNCALLDAFLIIAALIVFVVFSNKKKLNYWQNANVPTLPSKIPFGNLENPFARTKSFGEMSKEFYEEFKRRKVRHGGVYSMSNPVYFPIDLDIVKSVLTRDFQHFVNRGFYHNIKDDPLSGHLFFLDGNTWKNLRAKLTSIFTSGKMKAMFPIITSCAEQLKESLENSLASSEPVEIKDVLACFTTDVIGSCAFGLECNSFKDPNSDFRHLGNRALHRTKLETFRFIFCNAKQDLSRFLGLKIIASDVSEFFTSIVKKTVRFREDNGVQRNDFLQLLIDLKNSDQSEERFTIGELTAQSFVFFIAGFDTSSTTMAFCLFELAKDVEIQNKVREEMEDVLGRYGEKMSYEAVMEMKFLHQVIEETLRKYPPLPVLNRKCTQDYRVPGSNVILKKGTDVLISVLGLHRDPQYFPNPDKFDPDRFNEQNKKNIPPYSYLPFGEGPRVCIGLRFGLMQVKIGLCTLLKHFRFKLNPQTKDPIEIDPYVFLLTIKGGIWLDVEKAN